MRQTFEAISQAALLKKSTLQNSRVSYFILTILGGLFVGFGIVILVTIGGLLDPVSSPYMKIIQGLAFGIALTIVIMAGADLFTGNNLVMTIGALEKQVTWVDVLNIWVASYIGNFVGSFLCAYLFWMTGLASHNTGAYIEKIASIKMSATFTELLFRGILCNILVCIAVWCGYKLKSEASKIMVIFCCIFPFITAGFEHSVANMTLFSLMLLISQNDPITVQGMIHNLISVSVGNILGGAVLVGAAFWFSHNRHL